MIRCFYLFIFFAFLFACDTASNVPSPNKSYFIKYFGGDGDQTARDLIVNKDGTFFILGNSIQSGATSKVYLAKANALGELISQTTFGADTEARDFALTSDGKIAVVANKKNVTSSNVDILLIRFTLDLIPLDSAILFAGSSNSSNENANSLIEISDGGFIVEGYVGNINQSAELHLRVDNQLKKYVGTGSWSETNGVIARNVGVRAIQNVSLGEYYTFGHTDAPYQGKNSNNIKFWAFNYKDNGIGINNTDLPFFEQSGIGLDNTLTDAAIVPSGGYLLAGISSSPTEDNLKVVITSSNYPGLVFDYSGVSHDLILMDNSSPPISLLGRGPNPFATVYSSIKNHNFILANKYNTPTGKSDILLVKIDNNLVSMWGSAAEPNYVSFGGDGDDTAAAVAELPDGHIMVLGTMQLGNPATQSKIALMKLNSSGKLAD
jgi:hypothetical protein